VTDGATVTVGTPPPPWHWLQTKVEFLPPELARAGVEAATASKAAAWRNFIGTG